jgi:L,D-peptidoglycan transpeptidase YkuD (ErfK/YbiS/YcfS/YnhG family)
MRHQGISRITVFQRPQARARGLLVAGALCLPVALGAAGMRVDKREGDGTTPIGTFRMLRLWRRPGRGFAQCGLPQRIMRVTDLWCDASGHRLYNRPARAPLSVSHETMWRADALYDAVIEIGWNIKPRIMGRGSAIFMHLAREGYLPTAGCVALHPRDMRKLLPLIGTATRLILRR